MKIKKTILAMLILSVLLNVNIFGKNVHDKLISLNFKNTDIKTVLSAFAQKTGLNVIPNKTVTGKVTADITKMNALKALEGLLDAYGYTYTQKGKTLYVTSIKTNKGLVLRTFSLQYIQANELKNLVLDILDKSLGEGVSVSPLLNSISIQTRPQKMQMILKMIKDIVVAPMQVHVEAKIIELKSGLGDTSNPSSVGVNWKYKHSSDNYAQQLTTEELNTAATSLGNYAQILSENMDLYLSALEKSVGYDLIASPWITALNHQEASILIGSKYGYKSTITTTTGTLEKVEFLEVGTKLRFTPHINQDGYIRMDIYPSISEGSVINSLPQESTTETKNTVLVKDGQTIVIGGLTKNYTNQIEVGTPILSNIPFLGMLFRRTELVQEKRDIMVLITPYILTPEFLEKMNAEKKIMEEKYQEKKEQNSKLIY